MGLVGVWTGFLDGVDFVHNTTMVGLVKPITLLRFDALRRMQETLIEGIDRV